MIYAVTWFLSMALLALWSLTCWVAHAVTVWAIASTGNLANGAVLTDVILLPEWIKGWVPPQLVRELGEMMASVGPMVQAVLETVPALSGAITLAAWVIWGLGALALVALAFGAHMLIALFRRRPARLSVAR